MGNSNHDQNDGNSNFLAFATGALIGGALGTVLGIFLAPKSGTEMRYQLSEGMHDAQSKTKQVLGETKTSISHGVDKASKNLESTVKRVTEAFNAGRKAAKESMDDNSEISNTELENTEKFADFKNSDKIPDITKDNNSDIRSYDKSKNDSRGIDEVSKKIEG